MGRPSGPAASVWAVCALVAAAMVMGVTLAAAAAARLDGPYADPHAWIAAVFAAEARGDRLAFLWTPFNQQRIPLALAAQALDVQQLGGRSSAFLIAGSAALSAGLAGGAVIAFRSRLPAPAATGLALAATLSLWNIAAAEDLAFPVFSVYPLGAGFAAAAFAAWTLAPRIGWGGPAAGIALAAATLASGANAAGLVVWPVLILWSLVERRDVRQQAMLWIAALVVGLGLEAGLGPPLGDTSPPAAAAGAHLWKQALYFTGFAGLGWPHPQGGGLPRLVGVAVTALALLGMLRRPPEGAEGRARRFGRLAATFGLAAAALATLGRVDELPDPVVPTRYYPFAALLQLGALFLWSDRVIGLLGARPRATVAAAAIGLLAVGAVQTRGALILRDSAARIRAASRAFDAGDRSPAVISLVDPYPQAAARVREALRRRGLPW